jgi:hypothetical protein
MRTLDTLCLKEMTKKSDVGTSQNYEFRTAMNIGEMRNFVAKFRTLTIITTEQFNSKGTYNIYSSLNRQRNKNIVLTGVR